MRRVSLRRVAITADGTVVVVTEEGSLAITPPRLLLAVSKRLPSDYVACSPAYTEASRRTAALLGAVCVYDDVEASMKHPRHAAGSETGIRAWPGHRQDMVKCAAMIYASVLGNCG